MNSTGLSKEKTLPSQSLLEIYIYFTWKHSYLIEKEYFNPQMAAMNRTWTWVFQSPNGCNEHQSKDGSQDLLPGLSCECSGPKTWASSYFSPGPWTRSWTTKWSSWVMNLHQPLNLSLVCFTDLQNRKLYIYQIWLLSKMTMSHWNFVENVD